MNYICPICGYDGLDEPPYDEFGFGSWEICSCCGFEFGIENENGASKSLFDMLRKRWIEFGAKWKYPEDQPEGWNLELQLKNIKKSEEGY